MHFHEQMAKTVKQLQMMSHVLRRPAGPTQPTRPLSVAPAAAVGVLRRGQSRTGREDDEG